MELDEQGRGLLERELGIGVGCAHLIGIEQLDAGDGDAALDGEHGGVAGALHRCEGHDAAGNGLRDAMQAKRQLGDDAKGALRADQKAGEIVTGRGFLGAAAGLDDAAIGHDRGEVDDRVAHGAVAHRIGAGGAGGGHTAERGVGAGIDGEEQAVAPEVIVELLAGHARLDHAIEITGMNGEDVVHAAEVDRDATVGCVDVTLERGAGAEGNDRHRMIAADFDDRHDILDGERKDHGVGRLDRKPGRLLGMLTADRLGIGKTIAEAAAKQRQGMRQPCAISRRGLERTLH